MSSPLLSLSLYNFRNYTEFSLNPCTPWVLVLGENGAGKTNLLESLFFLSRLKGFHNERWVRLRRRGSQQGWVKAKTDRGDLTLSWENAELIRIFQGERMRSPEWLPLFPVIALIPEDLVLLSENHEERRRRLDALGTFLDPEYLPALLRYHSALRQLKALLLYPLRQPEEIVVYSELMEKEGRIVLKKRDSLLKALEEKLRELAGSSRGMKPSLRYIPSPPSSTDDLLRAYRRGEFREGKAVRLCGPHRDDWELSLKDEFLHEMSQGQKKRLLLLMNLAEGSLLREARKGPPLLLWDELQEALDSRNLSFLLDLLKDLDLPVVTTSLDPFPSFARKGEWQVFTLRSPSSTPLPSA